MENKKLKTTVFKDSQKDKIVKRLVKVFVNVWFINLICWVIMLKIISLIEVSIEWKVTWLLMCVFGIMFSIKFWNEESK